MNRDKKASNLRTRLVALMLAAAAALTNGCATMAHRKSTPDPKPCGRPGEACPWLVGDALLLIPFLVPGVIAFVVDFSTGEWKHGDYGGEVRTASASDGNNAATGP